MLLLPVRLAPSRIHGLGIFPVAPVSAGAAIWRFEPGLDQIIPAEAWSRLPEPAKGYLRHYCYIRPADSALVLSFDFARFMNHEASPSTGLPAGDPAAVTTVALRDLGEDEELTCDYRAFDADAAWKLGAVGLQAPLGGGTTGAPPGEAIPQRGR